MYSEARYSNGVVGLMYVLDEAERFDQERHQRLKDRGALPNDRAVIQI